MPPVLILPVRSFFYEHSLHHACFAIRLVNATGKLFEDYGDEVSPLARQMLNGKAIQHFREIRIRHHWTERVNAAQF
ncbi:MULTISPECIES: hypothetical protein [Kosakonia]|uniref:Uncharacterized protein n=1 Tax=Kosakonia quasisacchari TaxID=2529380 RepID=A0A4R0H954_9ENTR|nr:hypothetical protein [Kosakonia quasisacchari]TCC06603.1 hypothetical protein E0L21_13720 [Kosakonia quasisacchari]